MKRVILFLVILMVFPVICMEESSPNSNALFAAAEKGNADKVFDLIDNGVSVDSRDSNGVTALLVASCSGNKEVVEALIKAGADVNIKDSYGKTPLHGASFYGHAEIAKRLISVGAYRCAKRDYKGYTPLDDAVENGHDKVVLGLLTPIKVQIPKKGLLGTIGSYYTSCKSSISQRKETFDKEDIQKVLICALRLGHKKVVDVLVSKGAWLYKDDEDGANCLMHAAFSGNEKLVDEVLELGIDPLAKDKLEKSCLMYAALGGNYSIVQKFLELGLSSEEKDCNGLTCLMYGAAGGNTQIVGEFLDLGANLDDVDNDGRTCLMHAFLHGKAEMAQELLELGALLDQRDNNGLTCLIYAALGGNLEAVHLLIKKGVDLNEGDNNGMTALMHAAVQGKEKVISALLEADAKLMDGVHPAWNELMRIALGYPGGFRDFIKIMYSAYGTAEMKEIALKCNCVFQLRLHAIFNRYKVGLFPILQDMYPEDFLHWGQNDRTEIMEQMAKYLNGYMTMNFRVNLQGDTPLMVAVEEGDFTMCQKLLKRGAKPSLTYRKDGVTAFDLALKLGRQDIGELLELYSEKSLRNQCLIMLLALPDHKKKELIESNEIDEDCKSMLQKVFPALTDFFVDEQGDDNNNNNNNESRCIIA